MVGERFFSSAITALGLMWCKNRKYSLSHARTCPPGPRLPCAASVSGTQAPGELSHRCHPWAGSSDGQGSYSA